MNEMRWVLLGGAAIVMAMIVAWTMQADTGAAPSARAAATANASSVGATAEAPTATSSEGAPKGPARSVGPRIDVRATYGNPLAAQLDHGKLVPVKPKKDDQGAAPADK